MVNWTPPSENLFLRFGLQDGCPSSVKTKVDLRIEDGNVGTVKAPGDAVVHMDETGYTGPDYVPKNVAELRKTIRQDTGEPHKVVLDPSGEDYISGTETKRRSKIRDQLAIVYAKELYKQWKPHIIKYKRAKALVESATAAQLNAPNNKLKRAKEIVRRGLPITKNEILKQARIQAAHKVVNDTPE